MNTVAKEEMGNHQGARAWRHGFPASFRFAGIAEEAPKEMVASIAGTAIAHLFNQFHYIETVFRGGPRQGRISE